MARALARGFVSRGLVAEDAVSACDPSEAARTAFRDDLPAAKLTSIDGVLAASAIVFLAVKPQHVQQVFSQVVASNPSPTLYVSIAAGITLETLRAGLATDRVIRVMPNTPCLVGEGASGFCADKGVSAEDSQSVADLLNAVGVAFPLPEAQLDAVTGLSGSGPAFVYQVIEALSDGGVRVGLPRDVALKLATQTVLGAARMVQETEEHPGVLKDRVASPGGTTIAGLHALESGRLRATLMDAVVQATNRSQELGHR